MLQDTEIFLGKPSVPRAFTSFRGGSSRVRRSVPQRSPVNREGLARANVAMGLDCLFRVHVMGFHEPAWLIGTDGDRC